MSKYEVYSKLKIGDIVLVEYKYHPYESRYISKVVGFDRNIISHFSGVIIYCSNCNYPSGYIASFSLYNRLTILKGKELEDTLDEIMVEEL